MVLKSLKNLIYPVNQDKMAVSSANALIYSDNINVYYGDSTTDTVDGSACTSDMDIYLANGLDNPYNSKIFVGINNIIGGSGNNILRGNENANTLDNSNAGKGTHNIMWGAAGNDVMKCGNGANQINYGSTDGKDIITGFKGQTTAYHDADNILLYDVKLGDVDVYGAGNTVSMKINNNNSLTIMGDGQAFKVTDSENKARTIFVGNGIEGNAMDYKEGIDVYYGNDGKNILKAGRNYTKDMDIYLANGLENTYKSTMFVGVDDVVGGSGNNILRGNYRDNVIDNHNAAQGTHSILWGGDGGHDILIGGAGTDQYNFGIGAGSDTIENSDAMDKVLLYSSTTLEPSDVISDFNRTTGKLTLDLGTDILTINNWNSATGMNTFQFGDNGPSYKIEADGKTWTRLS